MAKRLVVVAGPDEGRIIEIPPKESLLLGRSRAADAPLIDPHLSRVHCQVQAQGGRVILSDFDSAGGTWVNGQRIKRRPLQAGDVIRIGATQLKFVDEDGPVVRQKVPTSPQAAKAKQAVLHSPYPQGLVGQKLSHYKLMSLLAKGQAGYVFHGRDLHRNRAVAIKVLRPELSKNDKMVQRFAKAMKTIMPLRHPNLITVHTAGRTGPYLWIVMEYLACESLAAVVGRTEVAGRLDWRPVLRLAILIARALEYVHNKNIVHRNINPQNILLGNNPRDTKLTDLMLATALEGEKGPPITARTRLLIPVAYMSPERTRGQRLDRRADLYSLGATLYATLSGRPPFEAATVQELLTKIHNNPPPALQQQGVEIPEWFANVIGKMLAKNPRQRYQNAGELLQELEPWAQGEEMLP